MREFFNNAWSAIDQAVQQGRERAWRQQELNIWRASLHNAINEGIPDSMEAFGMNDFWDTVFYGVALAGSPAVRHGVFLRRRTNVSACSRP